MTKRPKLTPAERLLQAARENPSKTCNDPRQITLFDFIKRQAFANLDEVIAATIATSK
jgi:hypothetical protein